MEFDYKENYKRDVKSEGIVDKKGRFDYISWAHAEKIANELDPDFDWNTSFEYLNLGLVEIEMQFKGKIRRHKYPILNNQNKPIPNPTSFDLNNAQMRGFAKLFSMMTGIGLSLFTGEDLKYLDNDNLTSLQELQTQLKIKVSQYCAENIGVQPKDLFSTLKITAKSTEEDLQKAINDIEDLIKGE